VTNRKCVISFCLPLLTFFLSSPQAEQADIELCDKIMQLHPDFRAFLRGLSQDEETEGFNRFLSLVCILDMAYMR
jgi:hypothetical protein